MTIKVGDVFTKGGRRYVVTKATSDENLILCNEEAGTAPFPSSLKKLTATGYVLEESKAEEKAPAVPEIKGTLTKAIDFGDVQLPVGQKGWLVNWQGRVEFAPDKKIDGEYLPPFEVFTGEYKVE